MIMTADRFDRRAQVLSAAVALYYAILGLLILAPESVYSGDIGVQYVQAQSILNNRFRSLDIAYPGEFLDPARQFFPIRPPFVFNAGGATQSIFPPASALLQSVGVGILGLRGMIVISVIAAWVTLRCAARITQPPSARTAVVVALGLASPLWFYAVSGWHHAAGMALGTAAFMLALTQGSARAPFLAGLSLGGGAVLRDEAILLGPGVAIALWLRQRKLKPILGMALGALAALTLAALIDVWWFDRPPAAHLRHAVHLLQRALHTSDAANPELPSLHPFTMRERYETVVEYWLFGYGNDAVLAAYVGGLVLALLVRWRFHSAAGIVVWLLAVTGAAALDFRELITAPKWLAGLHRVAPYLVFALLPPPSDQENAGAVRDVVPRVALVATAAYLVLAFAGVDTTGGKGLGPRLLLPLLPILVVAAVTRLRAYLHSGSFMPVLAGRIGILLVAMTLIMHVYGTTVAYYARNRDDSSVVLSVAASRERIVIADDVFTAQLLFPLYYRKIILLADSREAADALGTMLTTERLSGALLVSRSPDRAFALPGLRVNRTEQVGRMSITHWSR